MGFSPILAVGIDPGMTPGVALVRQDTDGSRLLQCGTVRPKKGLSDGQRWRFIWDAFMAFVAHKPDIVVIEQQGAAVGAFRRGEHNFDNHKVHVVVGIALAVAWTRGSQVLLMPTSTSCTRALGKGYGRADDNQIRKWFDRLPKAPEITRTSVHARDAAVLAVAGARTIRHQRHTETNDDETKEAAV